MRDITTSESKTKKRVVLAAGVFGFVVGIAGALLLDQLLPTGDVRVAGGAGGAGTEHSSPIDRVGKLGGNGKLIGAANQNTIAHPPTVSLLRVTADNVNLRDGPAQTESAITRLKRGTGLIEIDRSENWIQVEIPAMNGQRGWIHESMVGPGMLETTVTTADRRAGDGWSVPEMSLGLTSDGKCQRATGEETHAINCLQRGDNDGAPDKSLDIFRDIIKLKKFNCDGRIEAASYATYKEKRIFLVQCGESPRYKIEFVGNDINIIPVYMGSSK